jgi:hypothetical protein
MEIIMRKNDDKYVKVTTSNINLTRDKFIIILKDMDIPKEVKEQCEIDLMKGSTFTYPDIIKEIIILHDTTNKRKNLKHKSS